MEIAGQNKPQKTDKLSAETKQLRDKRRQMKRGGTDVQNIEYVETCKAINGGWQKKSDHTMRKGNYKP